MWLLFLVAVVCFTDTSGKFSSFIFKVALRWDQPGSKLNKCGPIEVKSSLLTNRSTGKWNNAYKLLYVFDHFSWKPDRVHNNLFVLLGGGSHVVICLPGKNMVGEISVIAIQFLIQRLKAFATGGESHWLNVSVTTRKHTVPSLV
jgi:hypothetical protein